MIPNDPPTIAVLALAAAIFAVAAFRYLAGAYERWRYGGDDDEPPDD